MQDLIKQSLPGPGSPAPTAQYKTIEELLEKITDAKKVCLSNMSKIALGPLLEEFFILGGPGRIGFLHVI